MPFVIYVYVNGIPLSGIESMKRYQTRDDANRDVVQFLLLPSFSAVMEEMEKGGDKYEYRVGEVPEDRPCGSPNT